LKETSGEIARDDARDVNARARVDGEEEDGEDESTDEDEVRVVLCVRGLYVCVINASIGGVPSEWLGGER
jgi:hypothetical protein